MTPTHVSIALGYHNHTLLHSARVHVAGRSASRKLAQCDEIFLENLSSTVSQTFCRFV